MTMLQPNRTRRSRTWSARELRGIHANQLVPWLEETGGMTLVRKGAVLFREGELPEGLFYVKTGRIELVIGSKDGRHMTTKIVRRGQLLGLECVFANRPHEATARATGPATVCFVPRTDFLAFLDANSEVQLRILHLLCEDVRSSYDLIRATLDLRHDRPPHTEVAIPEIVPV